LTNGGLWTNTAYHAPFEAALGAPITISLTIHATSNSKEIGLSTIDL